MTDFQSEFVFGLHGKRYQDFYTYIAKPELEIITGTDDFELIGFEKHLSFKDFENKKVSIFPNFYTNFLNDIAKLDDKVTFRKKVCISLDERMCNDICPKTNRKISIIKIAGVELAYFVYFDIKEFYDFIYNDYTKEAQYVISSTLLDEKVPSILHENPDFNNAINVSKLEKNVSLNIDRNEKSIYKSFSELAVLKKDNIDENQINDLVNQNNHEFKEISGYIHNHNNEKEFSFIRISSDEEEGYRVWHIEFPDIKELREGTPVALILERNSFNHEFTVVDFKPCSYDDLNFVERFKGTLKKISNSYAIIKSEFVSIIVPHYLIQNLDEGKIYNVECIAVESYDRKKEKMGWQALDFHIM